MPHRAPSIAPFRILILIPFDLPSMVTEPACYTVLLAMWAVEQYTWIIPSSFVFHHHMYQHCISRHQQRSICFFFLALLLQDMPTTQTHMQLPVELTCRFAIPRKIGLDYSHSPRYALHWDMHRASPIKFLLISFRLYKEYNIVLFKKV